MIISEYKKYKSFIKKDNDIIKLKQKIKDITRFRQLTSIMNDTKWIELQKEINQLPFPPAYNLKLIHLEENEFSSDNFNNEPSYYGDWSSFWEEGLPVFAAIEWIEIRPKFRKNIGRLISPEIIDETNELTDLLKKLKIPFETKDGSIFIQCYK